MRISDWSSDVCSSDLGHITFEETLQESRHQPSALLREKAVLLDPHIVAVLEHLQGRCIGGGPPDSQFLQLLDQRRFGIARRLGEMLLRRRSEEHTSELQSLKSIS